MGWIGRIALLCGSVGNTPMHPSVQRQEGKTKLSNRGKRGMDCGSSWPSEHVAVCKIVWTLFPLPCRVGER